MADGDLECEGYATDVKLILPNLQVEKGVQILMENNRTVKQEKLRLLREYYIVGADRPHEYVLVTCDPKNRCQKRMWDNHEMTRYAVELADDVEVHIKEENGDPRDEEGIAPNPRDIGVKLRR